MTEIIEQLSGINKSLSSISMFFTIILFTILTAWVVAAYLYMRR